MSSEPLDPVDRPHSSRGRLRRSGRSMLRVGLLLLAISLVVTLVAGLATRSLLNHLTSNSSELLDGTATVDLDAETTRSLYVTGGLVAPGEVLPTPVEEITCTVTGPSGNVPVSHLKDEDRRVGVDNPLARFQVVGTFRTSAAGAHQIDCSGLGVVVAPEVSPASALMRLGGLMLGSLGVFGGFTLALIGGILSLVVRHGIEDDEEDESDVAEPPSEGAEEWWEEENAQAAAEQADGDVGGDVDSGPPVATPLDATEDEDEVVQLSDEELAALSEQEIADLLRSGALVYVDEDGNVIEPADTSSSGDERDDTYR
ncbi:hypothetical protein [Ornithinimicrobium cerasi]|uniref:Uncharacterized protein n=1 Tax=Ornithinimicrobium cerasi TaxID=2248773 RepID=A0A285VDB7_9MICO|nr:hypothetical protein [Ornithinimicrobium cerasi]SOC52142.1 hypothetical protein SAMN05421879_101428 [Ornithinimicrobium cerasi]